MAHAQRTYPRTIQGYRGKYTIAQIGCFLTAFCNLSRRFGDDISPDKLNRKFIEKGVYIDVDDGIRDDLQFHSITKYNKSIIVQKTGTSKAPPSKNAIVRIKANNQFGTHFCLVKRIEKGVVYIVDSWDGKEKKASTYGPITAWATYGDKTPAKAPTKQKPVAVKPVKKAAKPKYHTIKKGQYLSMIARMYGMTLGKLLNLNPQWKKNPNKIKAGWKARIK